jgi:hypothetical protein
MKWPCSGGRLGAMGQRLLVLFLAASAMLVIAGCVSNRPMPLALTPGHLCDLYTALPEAEAVPWRRLADERIAQLCRLLSLPRPTKKVQIQLFPDIWSTNRYLTERLPTRVGVESICFVDRAGYHIAVTQSASEERTRASLRHELLHFVLISQYYDLPPWVDEGLAQVMESEVLAGDLSEARRPGVLQSLHDATSQDWRTLLSVKLSAGLSYQQYDMALGLTWLLWHSPEHGIAGLQKYLSETHSGEPALADFERLLAISVDALPAWVAARLPAAP